MHNFKKFGALVAIFALSAIGAANASAATFTTSEVGNLSGKATETEVFTTATGGQLKCTVVETAGSITSTASAEQHVTVTYKNCTAFGFANVHVSASTYLFTANGQVHIKNSITINTTLGCHLTIHPQNGLTTGSYSNEAGGHLIVTLHLSNVHHTSTGGPCGPGTGTGTLTSRRTVSRVGGGSISFDA